MERIPNNNNNNDIDVFIYIFLYSSIVNYKDIDLILKIWETKLIILIVEGMN